MLVTKHLLDNIKAENSTRSNKKHLGISLARQKGEGVIFYVGI